MAYNYAVYADANHRRGKLVVEHTGRVQHSNLRNQLVEAGGTAVCLTTRTTTTTTMRTMRTRRRRKRRILRIGEPRPFSANDQVDDDDERRKAV